MIDANLVARLVKQNERLRQELSEQSQIIHLQQQIIDRYRSMTAVTIDEKCCNELPPIQRATP